MWRFIRKWWLLEKLDDMTHKHTRVQNEEFIASGKSIGLVQSFFVTELAKESTNRFRLFSCGRKDGNSAKNSERRKEKMDDYHPLVKECLKGINGEEKYIEEIDGIDANGAAGKMIVVSPDGYAIHGIMGLLKTLLIRYKVVWIFIIIPLSPYIIQLIKNLL